MSSSRDDGSPRESALLRGASAAAAAPYRGTVPPPREAPPPVERRTTIRRAADMPVPANRPSFRLGDVYAEELARLREHARREGYAAGHAEGVQAAGAVVAEAERAAEARLAEVQARWERRLVSATAALGAAVDQLEEAAVPVAEDVRDSVISIVLTLVEDLLCRELAIADSPALDALRRALTLCPAEAPTVVRLHPDDLAEIPEEALVALPDTVRVVGDLSVERAGAVAETGPSRVDAQLGSALERVRAVLAP
ncbi:FliH/SctL family protein [Geodermatophilus sabuli]|uniref:Flagellar assembly protein FliH n=1 Tax=Geodermatophilus sabuli TaxID=1564158 RepID=A0A285EG98_9ACTN|nr:FliH/SctL family protein [Geodermatophilus sabuli]MBB3083152.1 flagellar assembly protein FliH [Geodermatophilus sabuli]SNX98148.1 flagellar assembly protein FliH [Geodermatophilus sabuli]